MPVLSDCSVIMCGKFTVREMLVVVGMGCTCGMYDARITHAMEFNLDTLDGKTSFEPCVFELLVCDAK